MKSIKKHHQKELIKLVEKLRKEVEIGKSRWVHKYDDAPNESQHEMEGYFWALNDILNESNRI